MTLKELIEELQSYMAEGNANANVYIESNGMFNDLCITTELDENGNMQIIFTQS